MSAIAGPDAKVSAQINANARWRMVPIDGILLRLILDEKALLAAFNCVALAGSTNLF